MTFVVAVHLDRNNLIFFINIVNSFKRTVPFNYFLTNFNEIVQVKEMVAKLTNIKIWLAEILANIDLIGEAVLPYNDYRQDLMGAATLAPAGSFEVGTYQSFKLVYTAGKFGIDDQGGLRIGFRGHFDGSAIQFDDPSAPGYTTVKASNGALLEASW